MSGRTGVLSPRGAARGGLADLAEPTVAMADQRLDRRRRHRRLLRLARRAGAWLCVGLLVVVLGGALATGGRWFLTAPRFAVERVDVAGLSQLSADEVVAGRPEGPVLYMLRKMPGQEAKIAVAISHATTAEPLQITLASRTAEVKPDELRAIFDPIQVVQESLIDVGPCVSQRIIEAHGGHLDIKQGRAEVSFTATLPVTQL